ncbi:MAG TPA: hypothetical protein VMA34_06420 [Terracidiphilus sp.]|nr:hypothetical protein [Terracidiphilus sp.]
MSTISTKHEYRAPSDVIENEVERLRVAVPKAALVVDASPLLGTWINCDHETRGLVRVMIAAKASEITVHAFGACSPTPCDWGAVNGTIYAASVATTPAVGFTANYNFSFKQTLVVGHLFNGALIVETYDHFTDQSGRADYYSMNVMSK